MSRPAPRIRHDEITRMVKAVRACGLPVSRVTFDGERVDVIIGESVEKAEQPVDGRQASPRVKEVETL